MTLPCASFSVKHKGPSTDNLFFSGSLRLGVSLAPLPTRTASLPVPWWTAHPVPAVQGGRLWSTAHTHCDHVVRHDQREGAKGKQHI